jgi:ABC-type antimicrobial peptide transport system permease subunit
MKIHRSLSVFSYYRRNLSRVIIMVGSMAISILAIIAVAALTGSFRKDAELSAGYYDHLATFSVNGTPAAVEKALPTVRTQLDEWEVTSRKEGAIQFSTKIALAGQQQVPIAFLTPSDYGSYLANLGATLTEGNFPHDGTAEVAMSAQFMRNHHLVLGDSIGNKVRAFDFLPGKYTVVGIFDQENKTIFAGIGNLNYFQSTFGNQPTFFLNTQGLDDQILTTHLADFRTKLEQTYSGLQVNYTTHQRFMDQIDNNFAFMDTMVWSIMTVVILALTFSLSLFTVIVFMQRTGEFGLLAALGYTKQFIIRKTLFESAGQVITGWLAGIGAAYLVALVLNHIVFTPNEFAPLQPFTERTLIFTAPAFLAVLVLSALVVIYRLVKLDPITVIEKRD